MAIYDVMKDAAKALQEAGKIDLYNEILDAQAKLLELQKRVSDLDAENRELKAVIAQERDLIFENQAYWSSKDGKKDGPFCSRCWDVDKRAVRMHRAGNPAWANCPNCKASVQVAHDSNDDYRQLPHQRSGLDYV